MTTKIRKFTLSIGLFGLLLGCLIVTPGSPVNAASPQQLVGDFHQALLETMKDAKKLGFAGRYKKLAPAIEATFHLRLMIQVASGSFWREADETQRQRLTETFSKLSISTYASRFNGFSGQSFETLGEKAGPQKTTLVATRIVNPDGKNADLTYVAKLVKNQWQIVDVLLDAGISELAVRRSEYRRILKDRGIDGLISILNAKSAAMAAD